MQAIKKEKTNQAKEIWKFIKRKEIENNLHIHVTHNSGFLLSYKRNQRNMYTIDREIDYLHTKQINKKF